MFRTSYPLTSCLVYVAHDGVDDAAASAADNDEAGMIEMCIHRTVKRKKN